MPSIEKMEKAAVDLNRQAEVYLVEGRLNEAVAACESALKIEPTLAVACQTLGKVMQVRGEVEQAKQWYEAALDRNPNLPEVYANLGSLYSQGKQWKKAIASCEKAIALAPSFAAAYRLLAKIWMQLDRRAEAADCWYQAFKIEPNWATAEENVTLGNSLVELGKLDRATECYSRAIELDPQLATAYHNLGEMLVAQKRWDEAIANYQQAIAINPDSFESYHSLGQTWAERGEGDRAIACYRQSLEINPNYARSYMGLGNLFAQRREFDEAIQCYRQVLEINHDSYWAHNYLGESFAHKQMWQEAISCYRKALELRPDILVFYSNLGFALIRENLLEEAVATYRSQIEVDPNNSKPYSDLGNLLPRLGQVEEAMVFHQKAAELRGWPECAAKNYQFTQDWFTHNIHIWKLHLQHLAGIADFKVVEIGSLQGMSACWLLDNILTHPTANITCIDLYFQEQFHGNIPKTGSGDKVIPLQGYSQKVLVTLDSESYDIAYIDGCHKATSALQDAILSWRVVKVGGLMIFDDYEFTYPDNPEQNTKIGIDVFLEMFGSQLEVVHKGYQLIVKKIGNQSLGEEQAVLCQGWEKLGHIAADGGYLDEAIACYQTAIAIKSGNYLTYHRLGKSLQDKELWEEAAIAYQQAIALNPNFSWAYHFLGETLQELDRYGEAAAAYRKAIELNPDFCWNYSGLGDMLMKLSEWEEAATAYRKFIELNADFYWSYERLGKALIELENWEDAAAAYRKAVELNPDGWLYNSLAEVLEKQQNWPDAAVAFGRAVELEPEHSWLYKKLGDAWQEQGELERAIAIYEQGINIDPKSCWCYEGLGLSLMAQQQWEPAISNLVQALQIKPDLFGVYYHITYALEQKGEVSEADLIKLGYNFLPLSFLKKYCGFTDDLVMAAESDPRITCTDIYPASEINLFDSKTIDTNRKCWEDQIFYIKKSFVATIPNGRAWADIATTAAITSDNKLVPDISTGCPELVITSDKLPPPEHVEGNVAFLSARWGGAAYFHWMFDVVTRFELLQRCGLIDTIDKFVINACDLAYEKESLNTLRIPPDKILESRYLPHFTADKLIVPSICDGGSGTSKWKCEYLKRIFLKQDNSQNTKYSKRIYISRDRASYRRIVNDEEVVGCLEKFGFRTVKLEMMSVAEQAACLAEAEVVVAPHGGGLTNLVFCTPGTKVIEIFSPIYVPTCFWTISNLCELEHYYLIAELFDDQTHKYSGHKDMRVDVSSLEKLMNLAGVLHE